MAVIHNQKFIEAAGFGDATLDFICITVTEDDYVNEDNKRIFEYHAHCSSDEEKEFVNKLNYEISNRNGR